ncbi:MAG: hypothetical protein IJ196_06230, partial [Prevotella sp.]|nr:hypothetical protein [Prevotella sp.]
TIVLNQVSAGILFFAASQGLVPVVLAGSFVSVLIAASVVFGFQWSRVDLAFTAVVFPLQSSR